MKAFNYALFIEQFHFSNDKLISYQIMLNLRKTPSFIEKEVKNSDNAFVGWAKIILPPFVVYLIICVISLFSKIAQKIKGSLRKPDDFGPGEASKQFNRRRFQQHLQTVKLQQSDLGFTNQVLYQQNKKTVNYYLPVYITNKIKSIQDVSVQSLTGNISCALIVNVCFEGLPQQIVAKLQSAMIIQLNRGEAIKLEDDGISITVKRDKKSNFLIFTIRKLFLAFLLEDTTWSPFQLLELIISITLNTVTIPANSLEKISETSKYNPSKQYKISFNCMRNSDVIPISYALDCVFGVYDLAQKKLQSYHSRMGSYSEIQKNYEEYLNKQIRNSKMDSQMKQKEEKALKQLKEKEKEIQKLKQKQKIHKNQQKIQFKQAQNSQKKIGDTNNTDKRLTQSQHNIKNKKFGANELLQAFVQSTMKRLSIRPGTQASKKPPPKVKYFQYTHFVIPLYKYPGNSLATIFIPISLLALVSLTIFFQEPELSGRIGAIATMILGYIALIPSIKEQLPPSSKLTVIETVVYIETMCCLLCLYESFSIDGQSQYVFIWNQNITFLLCLFTHISTFIFIIGLYAVHKLKWEPEYNSDEKVIEIKPADNRHAWDNPYCDEIFLKFNKSIKVGKYTQKQREQMLIKPLNNANDVESKKTIDLQINKNKQSKMGNLFESLLKTKQSKNIQPFSMINIKKQSQLFQEPDANQFQIPDPKLYYRSQQKIKQI